VKLSQSSNAGMLEILPVELHHLLFDWLPFATLAHLNEVCSFWKAALDDETLWRRRYTLVFGPLSPCHLTLPLPPHLQGTTITPPTVLKWKKRFVVTRNLSEVEIRGPTDVNFMKSWPLFLGSSQLTVKLMGVWLDVDPKPEIALSAILVDDIELFEETLRDIDFTYHLVSKTPKHGMFT